jgi:hypothetical protein
MDIGNLIFSFYDTSGVGGAMILIVFTSACLIYFFLTRWILAGGRKGKE